MLITYAIIFRPPPSELSTLLFLLFADTVGFVYVVKSSCIYYWAKLVVAVVGRIAQRLEGDNRLVGILTTLDIVVFTVGNSMQFVSTYLPE
jgi:hypothetical protein